MSFSRIPRKNINSIYFVGTNQIEQKDEVRDLGVIFDAKLNFESHVKMLELRMRSMHGAAYKFSNEIHSQPIVLNIVQSYVCPIVEYASLVWRRQIKQQSNKLESSLRFATRLALGLPFSVTDERYKTYTERIRLCRIISMEDRAKIARVIFVCKSTNHDVESEIADIFARRITESGIRSPELFRVDDLAIGGPLRIILATTNELRAYFNLTDAITTTRRNLKNHFGQNYL